MTKLDLMHGRALAGSLGLAFTLSTGCAGPASGKTTTPTPIAATSGWRATFPSELIPISLKSAAAYTPGMVVLNLDSATPLTSLPNETAAWNVVPNKADPFRGSVVFQDTVPGLVANPTDKEQPFVRRNGSITAAITVNQPLTDARITARVNVTGGPGGMGTSSRQGPMLRWNGANEYIACFADFGTNEVYFWAARNAFQFATLGKQTVALDNKKSYLVTLEVRGQTSHCTVSDGTTVVADTRTADAKIPAQGSAGLLFELSQGKLEVPLEGSASEIETVALPGQVIPAPQQPAPQQPAPQQPGGGT